MTDVDTFDKSPKRLMRRRKKHEHDHDHDLPVSEPPRTPSPAPVLEPAISSPLLNLRRSSQLRHAAHINAGLTSSREDKLPDNGSKILNQILQHSPRSLNSSPRSTGSSTPRSLNSSPRRSMDSPRQFDIAKGQINVRELLGKGGVANVYKVDIDGLIMAAKKYHDEFLEDDGGSTNSSNSSNSLSPSTSAESVTSSSSNGTNLIKRNTQVKLESVCGLPYHPNIVRLFGYRLSEELIVLMELMDCTLRTIIDQRRKEYYAVKKRLPSIFYLDTPPFTRKEVLNFFEQIITGITFLHKIPQPCNIASGGTVLAVWHRDLKSENILVNKIRTFESASSLSSSSSSTLTATNATDPVQLQLKICDFDEAHIVYDKSDPTSPIKWVETDDTHNTMSMFPKSVSGRKKGLFSSLRERLSANIGTPQFMAPEIFYKEASTYNEKVDIWSCGMILYELLTMELPYGCDPYTQFDLPDKIQQGVRPTLPEGYLNSREWLPIVKLFMDCTELDPLMRPSAAKLLKFIRDLKE